MLVNFINDKVNYFIKNRKKIKDINDEPLSIFDIIVIILSFYTLIAFGFEVFSNLSIETKKILRIIDFIVCISFFLDFIIDYRESKNKLLFLK
jgi:hypothetical protein